MSNPIAVLISDVHYSLNSLKEADAAFRAAIQEAAELDVPLIDAGDITNDKAILRAEVIKTIIDTMKYAYSKGVDVTCIVGNHSLVNEKSKEHALHFLMPYAKIVTEKTKGLPGVYLIPYHNSVEDLKRDIESIPEGSIIIGHQGVRDAYMGEYVVDKTSADPEIFANYRTILGHYHRAQDIKAGRPREGAIGLISYIGSPYTTSFAEANDGPKGFKVLYDDGHMELVPVKLRKHVIVDRLVSDVFYHIQDLNPGDKLWIRVTGTYDELSRITKKQVVDKVVGHTDFKFDKIFTTSSQHIVETHRRKPIELFDKLIEDSGESMAQINNLKTLLREIT